MGMGKTEARAVQVNVIFILEEKGMILSIANVWEPATDF